MVFRAACARRVVRRNEESEERMKEKPVMHIPEGYGTVFPYFIVSDANLFADFLKKAFDAEEMGRTVMPNGRIANIRIRIGTSTFMISAGGQDFKPMPAACYIYVENADQT